MAKMYYMEKSVENGIAKAVVFSEETKQDYLVDDYTITGEYEIKLLEGDDFLPEAVGES